MGRHVRIAAVGSSGPVSARQAHLRYVSDGNTGIRRRRAGSGFTYVADDRRSVSAASRARIRSLAIPPAWTDVWIAADPRAHLQATGRDARGRKQYRYHPSWSAVRDGAKYERLLAFGRRLPALRRQVAADRRRMPLSRAWVLATVVALLERTLIRVGNDEYARANGSYGLTTLRDRHARIRGGQIEFVFRAKSGIDQRIAVNDASLARRVKRCQDLPGQTLFQYIDDAGHRCAIGSSDVNRYLREAMGAEFTAKDFRTWAGTVAAALALGGTPVPETDAARKREVVRAIDDVAARLGNTRSVCRKCYVHPAILEAYSRGQLAGMTSRGANGAPLAKAEQAVLDLLSWTRRRQRAA